MTHRFDPSRVSPEQDRCDFCKTSTLDMTVYPIQPWKGVRYGVTTLAACPACNRLIESGDREGLARRAVSLLKRRVPGSDAASRLQFISRSHEHLLKHVTGKPSRREPTLRSDSHRKR